MNAANHPRIGLRWQLLLLLGFALLCWHPQAHAGSCSASTPNVSFGAVNFSTTVPPQSQQITVSCSGYFLSLLNNVRVCVMIGTGVNPTSSNISSRAMGLNGGTSSTLPYGLYSDGGYSQNWGYTGTSVVSLDFPLSLVTGQGSSYVLLYPKLPAVPATVPAGTYMQSFGGDQTAIAYQIYLAILSPPACGSGGFTSGTLSFQVTAVVGDYCQLSLPVSTMNFGGSVGILSSSLPATTSIGVQCTSGANGPNGTGYTISLDRGSTSGSSLSDRRLAGSGGAVVHYQLYTDAARSTVWGDGTASTATAGGIGSGTIQTYTVYGQVPAQTTPAPGTYTDTVTVTVAY